MPGASALAKRTPGKRPDDGRYQRALIVDAFRAPADVDDTAAMQRAIAAAIAGPVKNIALPGTQYTCSGPIDFAGANGVTFSGAGLDTTIITVSNGAAAVDVFFTTSGACSGITIQDLTVQGTVVDNVTTPSRPRTTVGGGLNGGVRFRGNLNPDLSSGPTISDIRLRRMKIAKTNALPFLLDGIRGYAQVDDVETYLTMDGSWIFCENVVFDNIRSFKSADNGFSISRGCKKVTGGRVNTTMAAYYGLWVSGWLVDLNLSDIGPVDFAIDTLNVTNVGMGGLKLDDAPMNGLINTVFVDTVLYGSTDEPTEAGGLGILVGGNPSQPNRNTVAAYANTIKIGTALLINCARGGVLLSGGIQHLDIGDITIYEPGSKYHYDGTTITSAGDHYRNFGIAVLPDYAASVSNVTVNDLRVVDRRATPYTNYPIDPSASPSVYWKSLRQIGVRNPMNGDNVAEVWGGSKTFTQHVLTKTGQVSVATQTAGASSTIGSNGADDIAGTINVNAPATPVSGSLVAVSFSTPHTSPPHVVLSPTNAASAACQPYVLNRGLTSFQIACGIAPAANASLQFDYHVLQTSQ